MSIMNMFSKQGYQRLQLNDGSSRSSEDSETPESKETYQHTYPTRRWKLVLVAPWALTTMLLAVSSIYLAIRNHQLQSSASDGSICKPQSFEIDLEDARPFIKYERRAFTGALKFNTEKHIMYRDVGPAETQYFGQPSVKTDLAWEALLKNEFPAMSEEEAQPFLPDLHPFRRDGEYHFELDITHSLHCVNAVRKSLDKDYYDHLAKGMPGHNHMNASFLPPGYGRMHIDHCVDHLRQAIQCHDDLTPAPLYSWGGFPVAFAVAPEHTCRRWERIRNWYDKRAANGKSLG